MRNKIVFFMFFFINLVVFNAYADTISNSFQVNAQIPIGGATSYSVPITGAPSNGIITSVEAMFSYTAYNGTERYVSCRFNKGADPGSAGGAVLVAQGSLPSGNPGTYGYQSFSNWNGQSVNGNYYFRFATASGSPYAPTISTIYVRVNYTVPTLTVTYPNGGQTLIKGQNYTITWTSSNVTGNIQIDLYKGSTNVLQLAAGASNTGSYTFNPPTSLADGSDYRIAISAMSGTVSDFSNSSFAIQSATLTVTYPNGGQTLIKGQNYTITWTSSNVTGNVQIDLYKGSTNVQQLAASASNTGSYTFNPPTSLADGSDYRIAISAMSGAVSDFSNSSFSIQSATLTVTYPNGGETLIKGQNYTITWTSSNVTGNIQIDLYKGSTNVLQLAAGASNTGSYTFNPPTSLADGSDYRIAISAMSGLVSDFSDSNFSIQPSVSVTLRAPLSGSTMTGATITFDWDDVSGAESYEIIVDNNSGLGSPEWHEPGYHVQSLTQSTSQVTNWLPNNVYYWKVIAHLSGGGTAESPTWSFTYQLADASKPVWVPLYRFYKSADKDHFYTTSIDQGTQAITDGYTYERVECYVSDRKFSGGTPLIRLYNPTTTSHMYTTSEGEKDSLIISGYRYEGIQGWVYSSANTGAIPLHRLKQTGTNHYLLTARDTEYYEVLNNAAWNFTDDGLAGYVYSMGIKNTIAHTRPQGNYGGADMATRAFRSAHTEPDLAMNGVGPGMVFRHTYNSFNFARVPMGPGWSHNFYSYAMEQTDGNQKLVIIRWGNGTETYFTSNDDTNFTPEPGKYETLTKLPGGINEGYNVTTKDQTVFAFRKLSVHASSPIPGIYLTTITDKNNNTVSLSWEASHGLLSEVLDSTGRRFTFAYNDPNNQLLLTGVNESALGRSVYFAYDEAGRLISYTDAKGLTTTYGYDENDRVISIKRPRKNVYTITYSTDGQVVGLKDGANPSATITPVTDGTQVQTPQGNTLTFQESDYRLTSLVDGKLQPTDFVYGDTSNPTLPTRVTERAGTDGVRAVTQYTYDTRGNTIRVTNHLGYITEFTYDTRNNLLSSTDFHQSSQNGHVTYYTYDAKGNLTDIDYPNSTNTHLTPTPDGRGLIQSRRDGLGNTTNYTYDAYGNLYEQIDAEMITTVFNTDAAGRLTSMRNGASEINSYGHDANDNLISLTDNSNFPVTITYDDNNNISNVQWVNNAMAAHTGYGYDDSDHLIWTRNQLNLMTGYTYNSDDTLLTKTNRNNRTLTYGYDANSLLTSIQYSDHTRTITRYDNGLLHSISSRNGATIFEYTALGQVRKVTDPYGKVVQYTYDERGNLTQMTYPGSKTVTYGYDALNRLISVKDWVNAAATSYIYDAAGNLTHITRPNGTEVIYTYDRAARLTGIREQRSDGTVICTYGYTLDGAGRQTAVSAEVPLDGAIPQVDIHFTYDEANRLLTSGTAVYGYDNNGNRMTLTDGSVSISYTWDDENMLTGVTPSTGSGFTYLYDGLNNRIAKTVGGVTTRYVLDLAADMSRVLAEADAAGNITAYYVYGLGMINRIAADSSQSFYHFNNRGDTIALTDVAGTITDSYFYDEYGRLLNVSGSTPNPFTFVGMHGVMDEGNNLYFMRARYYDASARRFLNEDPIGFEGGDWNMYGYVGGDPLTHIDPEGTGSINPAGAFASAILETPSIVWNFTQQSVYTYESVKAYFEGDYAYSREVGKLADQSANQVFSSFGSIVLGAVTPNKGSKTATKVFGKTGILKLIDMRTRGGIVVKVLWAMGQEKVKDKSRDETEKFVIKKIFQQ
jgi:RHS repeat-associated protein